MTETVERMTLPPRSTRGMRMTKLMEAEEQADEEFWNQAALAEEEDDREYSTEESVGDEFDSDFNDTEDDEDDEEVEAEKEGRRTRRLRPPEPKKPAKATASRSGRPGSTPSASAATQGEGDHKGEGKDKSGKRGRGAALQRSSSGAAPAAKRVRFAGDGEGAAAGAGETATPGLPDNRDGTNSAVAGGAAGASAGAGVVTADAGGMVAQRPRKSQRTAVVEKDAERERLRALESASSKAPRKQLAPATEHRMTQEEMLLEAAQTEILNQQSLESLLAMEEAIKKKATVQKAVYEGPRIRYVSRNGRDVLEFIKMDRLPAGVCSGPVAYPEKPICPVTGLVAKYRDPKTGTVYATLDAYKTIRAWWESEFSPSSGKAKEKKKADGLSFTSPTPVHPSGTTSLPALGGGGGPSRSDVDIPLGHIPVTDGTVSSSQYILSHKPGLPHTSDHPQSLPGQPHARSNYSALDARSGGGSSQTDARAFGGSPHVMASASPSRAGMGLASPATAGGRRNLDAVVAVSDRSRGELPSGSYIQAMPREPPVMHLGGSNPPNLISKYVIH